MASNPIKSTLMRVRLSTSEEWIFGKAVIICPHCACSYVHGPHVQSETTSDQVEIQFQCENDHAFALLLRFHKGHMIFEVQGVAISGGCAEGVAL